MDLAATAQKVRWISTDSVEEQQNPGGLLARAVDQRGEQALFELLRPGVLAVELEDGPLSMRLEPTETGMRLHSRWASGEQAELHLVVPGPKSVSDLGKALQEPQRPLFYARGNWWSGWPQGPVDAMVSPVSPGHLGSSAFRRSYGLKYSIVAGAMAGGIASENLVESMSQAGMLAFFGAGGLGLPAVEAAAKRLSEKLAGRPFGFNLLHNPHEPSVEEATVDLYLRYGIRTVDASAYMQLTPAVVRYRLHGIQLVNGQLIVPNKLMAKVSRPEVAEQFLKPAPASLLEELVGRGVLSARQAELARHVPMADDITAEADSGGHTDRRPLTVLIPLLRRLRDRISLEQAYSVPPRIGAAGGIGDPWSAAGAFALGADYLMTGSVNQATVEAGTSQAVREMLAAAGYADVAMGPAPDMFELGAQVQVLSRGSMYAQRAGRLYELYRSWPSLEMIPATEKDRLERQIFGRTIAEVWAETEAFWKQRDPREIERAAIDPHHRMALCFRWYLGLSSRWARSGEPARKRDYQIWCGPAMGLFNDWVRGTWLEPLEARTAPVVNRAILHGASVAMRIGAVRAAGLPVPPEAMRIVPKRS